MPLKKDILYPIFLECCQYTKDNFWENIFEDLAYGKTPHGAYISKDFLCCSHRHSDFSYKIERKDARQVYDEVYNLLTVKLGLFSQRERVKRRKAWSLLEESLRDSRKDWNSIRRKNVKELLIEMYVIRMKAKHHLSLKQARYLLSTICMAMVFRGITANDIHYEEGAIQTIDGIDFKKRKVIINRDLHKFETSLSVAETSEKKVMLENWTKYLRDLEKSASGPDLRRRNASRVR